MQSTPRLRVLSHRIPQVLVFVYFYRGLSGIMEERPTRQVYIEIINTDDLQSLPNGKNINNDT